MDFVTGMLTAQRYVRESDSMQKEFIRTFMNNNLSASKKDIQATESILSAWAEQHPEQTDMKEEKTMDTGSKRTRVHELIDIDPDVIFYIVGQENIEHKCNGDAHVMYKLKSNTNPNGWQYDSGMLESIINGTATIIRRPALTDDQREVLEWLDKGGFDLLVYDPEKNNVIAWQKGAEPHTSGGGWSTYNNKGAMWGNKLSCLRPLLPTDWTNPLDIKAMLKEAGV